MGPRTNQLLRLSCIMAALTTPIPLAAQASFGAAAGIFGFSGDEWGDVGSGFGAEGSIDYRFDGPFSLGGVFHWSAHEYTGPTTLEFPGVADETLNQIALMAQPLFHLGSPGQTDIFVGLRGGYVSVGDIETATGFLGGPVAGVGFAVASNVAIGGGGTWTALSLGRPEGATSTDRIGGSAWGAGAFVSVVF